MISHVLFDFGGVVINHKAPGALPKVYKYITEFYGCIHEDFRTFWRTYIEYDYMAWILAYKDVLWLFETHFWKALPDNHKDMLVEPLSNSIFYQEVENYIYKLQEQWYVVCLLSDMNKEWKEIFEWKNWYTSFNILFNSCDLGYSKAKDNRDDTTDIYDHVLRKLWVSWEQCVFIDDKLDNCHQANKVWIHTIQAINPEQTIQAVSAFLEQNKE